jgi:hypothetical protein
MDGSYYQVVARTLAGERPVDEQTHASVAILSERLGCLKEHGGLFAGIEFSPHVEGLRQRSEAISVG